MRRGRSAMRSVGPGPATLLIASATSLWEETPVGISCRTSNPARTPSRPVSAKANHVVLGGTFTESSSRASSSIVASWRTAAISAGVVLTQRAAASSRRRLPKNALETFRTHWWKGAPSEFHASTSPRMPESSAGSELSLVVFFDRDIQPPVPKPESGTCVEPPFNDEKLGDAVCDRKFGEEVDVVGRCEQFGTRIDDRLQLSPCVVPHIAPGHFVVLEILQNVAQVDLTVGGSQNMSAHHDLRDRPSCTAGSNFGPAILRNGHCHLPRLPHGLLQALNGACKSGSVGSPSACNPGRLNERL